MTVEELLASKQPMRAWLGTKSPLQVVGYAGETMTCPIASYLAERLTLTPESVLVTPNNVYLQPFADSDATPLPSWAVAFVGVVDTRPSSWPLTADEALVMLDEVS